MENNFIKEEIYQKIKKEMCKQDDFFNQEELEILIKKIVVILS